MPMRLLIPIILMLYGSGLLHAQQPDTAVKAGPLTALPAKYLEQVSSKTDKYYNSITGKTEKTLAKLSKWEAKIKTILEKTSPETAQRLFGNNQLTFAALLQKYREGQAAADNYKGKYDEYRDKVTTSLRYFGDSAERFKSVRFNSSRVEVDSSQGRSQAKISSAVQKITKLNEQVRQTEAVEEFIKERKKQLMQQALQYIGKSKYLQKINKQSYYYIETLRNYKEIFSDPKKTEELAMQLLQKIPAFNEFIRKNSMLASLFRMPGDPNGPGGQASLAGLQTRAQVNGLIQQQLSAGGTNAQQQFQQNMQAAHSQLNELKNKIIKGGGSSSSNDNIAEGFKPNTQKSKTFLQRLEIGTNVQTQGARYYFPVTSDLGLSVGYKLNDKSMIGIGASYKLGWGTGWNNIKISHQGAGVRSFVDWKAPFGSPSGGMLGGWWISGGFEMNYKTVLATSPLAPLLGERGLWQQSGLIGLSKSVPIKSKFFKKTKVQLLWDFMSYQQVPKTQPVLVRVGYGF